MEIPCCADAPIECPVKDWQEIKGNSYNTCMHSHAHQTDVPASGFNRVACADGGSATRKDL